MATAGSASPDPPPPPPPPPPASDVGFGEPALTQTAAATVATEPADAAPPQGDDEKPETDYSRPRRPRRRRVIRRDRGRGKGRSSHEIPESISRNTDLLRAIETTLPPDYSFEIPKTLHRIQQLGASRVALQMPEGLLLYATAVADILIKFTPDRTLTVTVLGDVTYGACCVDDLGAKALGIDLLVHYGHSCLVPLTETVVPCLYVFVEIRIDVEHLVECVCKTIERGTEVFVMGTVQFRTAVVESSRLLAERGRPATVPQAKPLSPGEVLGCTAPSGLASLPPLVDQADKSEGKDDDPSSSGCARVMLFVADGRFHLEAAMIANPTLHALRYDPYSKTLTDERYETSKMKSLRLKAIRRASSNDAKLFGIVLGTLGRQGNPGILSRIRSSLRSRGKKCFVVLLSEIVPRKLESFPAVDVWVQIACPRLSVDWGHCFGDAPVLNPYELTVALWGEEEEFTEEVYPMDYYKADGGPWSNYHGGNRSRRMTNVKEAEPVN